jgi:Ni/Co efflux regulator RcnB
MRKLPILLLLLATVAAPALAQADDGRDGRRQRSQSAEQSEPRSQRSSEGRRAPASERSSSGQRSEATSATAPVPAMRVRERDRERLPQAAGSAAPEIREGVRVRRGGDSAVAGGSGAQAPTDWRARERRVRTIPDTQPSASQPSTGSRETFGSRDRRDYRDGNYRRWSNGWRNDHRYDWRRHRDRHRSTFRIGFYYDPFGWNYRRWSIGSYLYPSYYRSSFWLNDPWQYRLPPAYGPYRWVRYWNDALLVNTYTGEVVDVIHGFFW